MPSNNHDDQDLRLAIADETLYPFKGPPVRSAGIRVPGLRWSVSGASSILTTGRWSDVGPSTTSRSTFKSKVWLS